MAGIKISQLPSAALPLTGAEITPIVQSGDTVQVALNNMFSASTGSSQVGFVASGTSAVLRTAQAKIRDVISVKDFGAVGDGTTDDTTAFNAAHTAAAAVNAAVYVPGCAAGYKLAGTVIVKAAMYGDGFHTSLITSSATADVLSVSVQGITLSDFNITTTVTRTAGSYIATNGAQFLRIERVDLFNWFNGIAIGGAGVSTIRLIDIIATTNVVNGVGITVNTSTNCVDVLFKNIFMVGTGTTFATQPACGLLIKNAGDITLNNVSTVKCGTGLNVAPGSGQVVQAIYVTDSFFDSGAGTGVQFNMTGTGSIQLAKFSNVWSCTNANGFVLGATASGTCLRSEFINCTGSGNVNSGFIVNYLGVTNTSVIGGSYANNTHGLYFANGVYLFSVVGVRSGLSGQFSNNSGYGLVLVGLNDQFTITGCDFTLNTLGAASIGSLSGTPGQTFSITNNLGLVTANQGQVTLSAASTTTVVNHGLANTPRIQDIKFTNNSGWGTAQQFWVTAPTSTQFTITTAFNPGAGVLVSWDARIWGS